MIINFRKKIAKFDLVKNQIIPSLIIFFLIFLMFAQSINDFNAYDNLIANFKVRPDVSCNKSINIDFKINSFMGSDFSQNILQYGGVILFEFDPKLFTEDQISNFTFFSAEELKKEKILDKIEGDKRYLGYQIQAKIKLALNFKLFPLDDHKLYIILLNYNLHCNNFSYCPKKFKLEANLKDYDWTLNNVVVKNGIYDSDLIFENQQLCFPAVLYQLDIIRYGFREILLILIPLFLVIFLTILMFARTNVEIYYADVTFGIVALFVAYRYSIDSYMPKTSHFILADFLFLFALLLSSLVFYYRSFKSRYLEKNSLYILIFIYLLTLGFNYYLLYFW